MCTEKDREVCRGKRRSSNTEKSQGFASINSEAVEN